MNRKIQKLSAITNMTDFTMNCRVWRKSWEQPSHPVLPSMWGYEVLSELPKERHERPMLSLDKTKDVERLKESSGRSESHDFHGNWTV